MNPLNSVDSAISAFEIGRETVKALEKFRDIVVHSGKEKYGEVKVRDHSYRLWEIKIRATGHRKRYLKFEVLGDSSQKFRASADGYKPDKYIQISPDVWNLFACLAEDQSDVELQTAARKVLNKLV